jgi:hypothetical protein
MRHLPALVVVVADPWVLPTNNDAARRRRQLVPSRTSSGGTRWPEGSATSPSLAPGAHVASLPWSRVAVA